MGVWGFAPTESDDFLDFNGEVDRAIEEPLLRSIEKIFKRVDREGHYGSAYRWAAIVVVLRAYHSGYIDPGTKEFENLVDRAIEYYEDLAKDEEWLGSWRDPKGFLKMFKAVGEQLESIKVAGVDRPRPAAMEAFSDLEHEHKVRPRRRYR